jgi:hypothetical protein
MNSLRIKDLVWEKRIKEAYRRDIIASQILERPLIEIIVSVKDEIILIDRRIYLPKDIRSSVFYDQHDTKTTRHQGIERILEKLQKIYYFPDIRKYVKEQISKYADYQRNKTAKHKPYGFI